MILSRSEAQSIRTTELGASEEACIRMMYFSYRVIVIPLAAKFGTRVVVSSSPVLERASVTLRLVRISTRLCVILVIPSSSCRYQPPSAMPHGQPLHPPALFLPGPSYSPSTATCSVSRSATEWSHSTPNKPYNTR